MSGRAFIGGACAFTMVWSLAQRQSEAADEPNLELPLTVCIATASGFIARTQEIKAWAKSAIGETKNGQLFAKLRTVASRRSGAPGWVGRIEPWSDTGGYTVHFAVGKVSDFQNAVRALSEAERRARTLVDGVAGGGKAFILDWYMNDDGVTYALAGAIEPAKAADAAAPAEAAPVETPPPKTPAP